MNSLSWSRWMSWNQYHNNETIYCQRAPGLFLRRSTPTWAMLRGLLFRSFCLQISPCQLSEAESRTEAYMRCDISRYQACTIDDSSYMSPIRPSRALGLTCSSSCTFSSRRSCPCFHFTRFFLWWNAIMKSTISSDANIAWVKLDCSVSQTCFQFKASQLAWREIGDSPLAAFSKWAENLLRQVPGDTEKSRLVDSVLKG